MVLTVYNCIFWAHTDIANYCCLGYNGSMHFWDCKTGCNFQKIQMTAQPGSLDSEAGIFSVALASWVAADCSLLRLTKPSMYTRMMIAPVNLITCRCVLCLMIHSDCRCTCISFVVTLHFVSPSLPHTEC